MADADPFTQFRFHVVWDDQAVPGVSKVSPLKRETAVVSHREGGEASTAHKSPGEITFEEIVLERERTADAVFETWADQVLNQTPGFRKDVLIELLDESGQPVLRYVLHRCWPVVYQPIGDLIADSNGIAVESMTLAYEGWTRTT